MKTIRKALSLIPLLLLWLMFSVFLWGFVFNIITDAPPEQKITLCVDAEVPGAVELAARLEDELGDGVRMVKVRPFSYAMFDSRTLTGSDLFIVPLSHVESYLDWFTEAPLEFRSEGGLLESGGVPYGVLAYDAGSGKGIADDCIRYALPGQETENYYLCFGKESLHLSENENAADGAAADAARLLLAMR